MSPKQKSAILWSELTSVTDIKDRRLIIYKDAKCKLPKYLILAEEDPHRLFELLGGNDSEIETFNWAFEYTYEDHIEESGDEYNAEKADAWNLEEKSIERAKDTGHWYVTGICKIVAPNSIQLDFEFEYCDGILDAIIGTPYNEEEHCNHGIPFY